MSGISMIQNNIQSRENFLETGGKKFNYITALNDSKESIYLMEEIIINETLGWDDELINSKKSLQLTKESFEKHSYNKKIWEIFLYFLFYSL